MIENYDKRRKAARALLTPTETARLERLQAAHAAANKLGRRHTIQRIIDKLDGRAEERLWQREIAADTPQLGMIREPSNVPAPPFKRFFPKPWCG
jgi:hypothetical protein